MRGWILAAAALALAGCQSYQAPGGSNVGAGDDWPSPGGDFEIMKRVKHLFDPGNLLNRGRLYRLI